MNIHIHIYIVQTGLSNGTGPGAVPGQTGQGWGIIASHAYDISLALPDGIRNLDCYDGKQKIYCAKCTKKCSGEVLRVADNHFHKACFQCCQCKKSLATGGFFTKDSAYYCIPDYQRLYGTKCATCQQYVEGEVVSTMGKTYHQKCFTCSKCQQPFKSGSKVTNTGKEVLCEHCVSGGAPVSPTRQKAVSSPAPPAESPTRATAHQQLTGGVVSHKAHLKEDYDPNDCAGCGELLKEGQALVALDRQWHVSCFRCKACQVVLNGEYMGKDAVPYCEKCYQKGFGVKCAYCNRFISGKVLQAGDNHHFHPTCARCTKCGDPFGDGEEMYLQGSAIWHPRCGPGPSESGIILNGGGGNTSVVGGTSNGNFTDTECDRMSSSALSEMYIRSRTPSINGSLYSSSRKHYRTVSPGLILREYGRPIGEDISRIYTYSYLTDAPHYLRKPIDPYDKTPLSPHFHRPASYATTSNAGSVAGSRPPSRPHSRTRSAMKVLVDAIRSETPRPKSPGMNNEEPIELSHYPDAKKPLPGEQPKIERDDFPAPPYPYTDPERRRRYSDTYKGVPVSDDEDENVQNGKQTNGNAKNDEEQRRLQREAAELEKLNSGIGSVIAKDLKEHAKHRKWKQNNLDPRNASRTPSASKEPLYKLRYESPIGASPSRHLDSQKPFYEDEMFDRSTSYRGSLGKSLGNAPSYNVVSALRHVPKPGYGLAPRSHTFSSTTSAAATMHGATTDFSYGGLGDKTHSTDLSCGKSEASVDSITEGDRRALMGGDMPASSTYSGALSYHYPQAGLIRRSLPNMAHSMLVHEPAKIYPYHLLLITNYRLPSDVDRCNLERHLSDIEFEHILQCVRSEFYRLPQWRRNELKRRVKLF
ncbi:actin-binding LIM protein 3 isoform X1 [Drosophila pseudoobscura]|uniref:Actin-binding LIM protein 3 isoform X1 n=1 Tax=Drosophila pseudoobscura pseudoobscura TaxID=46245 RepID=A0A6I8VDH8_DROPS|nr:actin-binding LIM protein 3 isoform X1 [Drosophila pseudoobscura]